MSEILLDLVAVCRVSVAAILSVASSEVRPGSAESGLLLLLSCVVFNGEELVGVASCNLSFLIICDHLLLQNWERSFEENKLGQFKPSVA